MRSSTKKGNGGGGEKALDEFEIKPEPDGGDQRSWSRAYQQNHHGDCASGDINSKVLIMDESNRAADQ